MMSPELLTRLAVALLGVVFMVYGVFLWRSAVRRGR